MKKALLILASLLTLASCRQYNFEEILLPREDVSLTVKGKVQFSYSPETCQMSHNETDNIYRVFDDKLSNWFTVECRQKPVEEGQELTADISWTASSSTKSMKNLRFRIEKMGGSGRIWMWCEEKSIGIVIKNL